MRLFYNQPFFCKSVIPALILFAVFAVSQVCTAQTTLISPTGDGGFENGSTFAANGWTEVNGATNQWFVGSTATASAGNNSAYISNSSTGSAHAYTITSSSTVHFYRDVTFPAGEPNIVLSFKWKGAGQTTIDYLTVYSMPTTVTPILNNPTGAASSWDDIPTSYSGAEVHTNPPNLNQQTTYQTQTVCLPSSYAGTTRRLVFMWSNNATTGTQPPASVDEISLVTSAPAAPANSPTNLTFTATPSTINGSFTAATGTGGYLVVGYPTGATPVAPVNGTSYTPGASLGTGRVLSAGTSMTFLAPGLNSATAYDFYVYSYNTTTCLGNLYKTSSPLTGTQSTAACNTSGLSGTYSVGPTGNYPTLTAAIAATTGGLGGDVIFELQTTYTGSGETYPITFPHNSCVSSARTIRVRPATGATGLSISSANTTATIDLNGARYVTIDGRPGGSGTTSQLTIGNTSTSGVAVRYIDDASNNTISYCTISGSNSSITSGVVLFSTTSFSTGNDNNTIDNCDIKEAGTTTPTNAIYSAGSTGNAAQGNSNNTISNNRIYNYFSATLASGGVKLAGGTTDWTISGNRFYQTASRTQTTSGQHSAIWIVNTSGNNFSITGNTIGYASAAGTGSYTLAGTTGTRHVPIFMTVGTTIASSVQGNVIAAINQSGSTSGTSTTALFRGIYVTAGLVNIGTVTGNTIGATGGASSISVSSSSASDGDVMGIYSGSSSIVHISNNTVAGISFTNSSTGDPGLFGIYMTSGAVNSTIQNNIIGSPSANSMLVSGGTATTATQVVGIYKTASDATVVGNTIRNLSANAGTGTTINASVIGIALTSTTVENTIAQNTIYNLHNSHPTAATTVTGIQYTGSANINIVERNLIYGLSAATNNHAAEINGIRIEDGSTTYRNNMIALGAGVNNAIRINGIYEDNGQSNIWNNSVYIGGNPATGSDSSFAFHSIEPTEVRSYRNNIFMNARSNTGGTGRNYAIKIAGTTANPTGLTINNNIYYANGTGGVFGFFNNQDVNSLPLWKVAVGQDTASAESNPQFSNPMAAVPDLHLHTTNPTPAEGNGADLGIANDFDGQTRSGLTPVDIGADAGNYVTLEIFPPVISYTALLNTSCTTNRIISPVTITDVSGVNLTAGSKPRLYYKKSGDANTYAGNTSSDNGWKYVEASGASSPYSFTIDYSLLRSALAVGDVIQYFVVAEDLAATPNVAITTGVYFNVSPTSVALGAAAFPITGALNSYTITTPGITGTVTIGASGAYTSLTGTGGLFDAINNLGYAGNITANIIDASVTEPGTFALNTPTAVGCATGAYTLLIKPQASVSSTLTGSSAGAIIKLNGADNVTIDGSNNGTNSKNLTITNTNTGTSSSVIWLSSASASDGATNNVIKNCILTGNNSTTTRACIASSGATIGSVALTANSGNTYQNNTMSLARHGVEAVGPTTVMEPGLVVANNTIGTATDSVGYRGIYLSNQNGAQVTGNTIQNLFASTTASGAILLAGTTNAVNISGNSISNINNRAAATTLSSICAIAITTTTAANTVINGNTITGIYSINTAGQGARAIIVEGNGTIVTNNMISDVHNYQDATIGNGPYGITLDGAITGIKVYNNSVHLFGSHPGEANNTAGVSAALYVNATAVGGLDIRNNILVNSYDNSTSAGDKAYAIYQNSTANAIGTIDNNDYYVSGSGSPVLAYRSGDLTTLAQMRSTIGGDAASVDVQPVFVSATNLHLSTASGDNWCMNGAGASISSVTTDIDAQARGTLPDIGADEFTPTDNSTASPLTQTICSGASVGSITIGAPAAAYSWTRDNTTTVTGLPASGTGAISGTLTNTTNTPVTVTFTLTPRNAAGCNSEATRTVSVVVNPVPDVVLAPASQTICTGASIAAISGSSAVTGATFDWSRDNTSSVTGISANGTGSISGTLANAGTSPVTVTFTATPVFTNSGATCTGTAATATVTVDPVNAISLTSATGTDQQSTCINSAMTSIAYATTTATGATFTGLPSGVSGSWANNVVTISGTPTVSGIFNYTVTLTGGCGTTTATGSIDVINSNTASLSSATGTDAQTLCINNPITTITYNTAGATGANVTGLPAGLTGTWASDVVTISGTPTVAGSFTYTVNLTGGCGSLTAPAGTITVIPNNAATLSSAAGTDAQTVCINSAITNITYATTTATGATVSGLPTGVSGSWANNVVTISGTPTVSGSFPYTVTLTGGCGAVTVAGLLTVSPDNSMALSSGAGSDAQSLCINTPITNISYTTVGATGATFTGLPAGVTGTWSAGSITISGSPSVTGTFAYTATLTGTTCGAASFASGTITVTPNNTIALSSASGTNSQSLCINTPITGISYATSGATGATFSGLPAGVTGTRNGNTITISGTPTVSGTFNYIVSLTGGCGNIAAAGTITVAPNNTITLSSGAGTNLQTNACLTTPVTAITYNTTGATAGSVTGLPPGVSGSWASNVFTISGTPTATGTYNYTVTLTGGCGIATATGTIKVLPNNTIALTSAASTTNQTRCQNQPITNITYSSTTATGAAVTGLPAGVTGNWINNVITISGTPTAAGVFPYTVTLTGGCSVVTATGTITVNALPNVTISPATATSVCAGFGATLTASGASAYTWTPAGGLSTTTGAVVTATPTFSTTYTVRGTDVNGCVNTASRLVTVLGRPVITVSPANPAPICEGTSIPLTAFGAATYTWKPAGSLSASTGATVMATPRATTTYTVIGTGSNGCVDSTTKTITVIPAPDATITPRGYVDVCEGDSVYLTAKAGLTNYNWTFYNTIVSAVTSNVYPTATGGYYRLTVTDNTGCSATTDSPTVITVISRPVSAITRAAGTAVLDAGAGFATYQWYLNGAAIGGATGRFHTATATGMYTVRLTESSPMRCDAFTPPYELRSLSVGGSVPAQLISLYPNPASTVLRVDAPIPVSVTITSMDGKQVYQSEEVKEIDISAWPDGIYRVVLHDSKGAFLKMEKITKLTR